MEEAQQYRSPHLGQLLIRPQLSVHGSSYEGPLPSPFKQTRSFPNWKIWNKNGGKTQAKEDNDLSYAFIVGSIDTQLYTHFWTVHIGCTCWQVCIQIVLKKYARKEDKRVFIFYKNRIQNRSKGFNYRTHRLSCSKYLNEVCFVYFCVCYQVKMKNDLFCVLLFAPSAGCHFKMVET